VKFALLALLVITAPVPAASWGRYENQLYGYSIDVPPGLVGRGEAGNGDGQDFTSPTVTLMVRALPTPEGFEAALRDWRNWEAGQGWNMVYEMLTPTQAALSARRAGWLMELRAVTICGDAAVMFQLEYGVADAGRMNDTVGRLASSLKATRKC
jgi:hypothetical protein